MLAVAGPFLLYMRRAGDLPCPRFHAKIQPWPQMSTTTTNVFNGYLEGITLADIVQLACLERYERKMEVRGENFQGVIYFSEGEIVHAETGSLTGTKAFLEIMCWPGGTFSFTTCRTETQTIHDSWNFLLMEAMRFIDERSDIVSLAATFTPLSVLVVDDSRIFTKALVKLFDEELGARIAGKAANVEDALKILEREKPDLVTMDVNMSVGSGYMPLKHIMIRTPVPVALMSDFSETNFSTMMEYLCLGAVDLVEKPKDTESWNIVGKRFKRLGPEHQGIPDQEHPAGQDAGSGGFQDSGGRAGPEAVHHPGRGGQPD